MADEYLEQEPQKLYEFAPDMFGDKKNAENYLDVDKDIIATEETFLTVDNTIEHLNSEEEEESVDAAENISIVEVIKRIKLN